MEANSRVAVHAEYPVTRRKPVGFQVQANASILSLYLIGSMFCSSAVNVVDSQKFISRFPAASTAWLPTTVVHQCFTTSLSVTVSLGSLFARQTSGPNSALFATEAKVLGDSGKGLTALGTFLEASSTKQLFFDQRKLACQLWPDTFRILSTNNLTDYWLRYPEFCGYLSLSATRENQLRNFEQHVFGEVNSYRHDYLPPCLAVASLNIADSFQLMRAIPIEAKCKIAIHAQYPKSGRKVIRFQPSAYTRILSIELLSVSATSSLNVINGHEIQLRLATAEATNRSFTVMRENLFSYTGIAQSLYRTLALQTIWLKSTARLDGLEVFSGTWQSSATPGARFILFQFLANLCKFVIKFGPTSACILASKDSAYNCGGRSQLNCHLGIGQPTEQEVGDLEQCLS